jgi:hypothetical protein
MCQRRRKCAPPCGRGPRPEMIDHLSVRHRIEPHAAGPAGDAIAEGPGPVGVRPLQLDYYLAGYPTRISFFPSGCPDGHAFKRRESRQHPLKLVGDDKTFALRHSSVLRLAFYVIAPPTNQSSISTSPWRPARTPLQQTNHFIKVHVTSSVLNFLDSLAYSLAALNSLTSTTESFSKSRADRNTFDNCFVFITLLQEVEVFIMCIKMNTGRQSSAPMNSRSSRLGLLGRHNSIRSPTSTVVVVVDSLLSPRV